MSLRFFNTLSRQIEPFEPIDPGRVRMYVCGITVYDLCHMGHGRMMVAFDVVQRWLRASGLEVTYVRNITDIDDKIIRRAVERQVPIAELTRQMIAAMHQDLDALCVERPDHEPRATQHVGDMLSMISKLEAKGLAYRTAQGDVNYSVRKFPGYGRLSGKSLEQLRAGERVAVDDGKLDPLDFVLWKAAKPEEPADAIFPSDYGAGRPGWHIECSAMGCALLGEHFDIHGGGLDLQFPHHENEIAQSEGATGQTFVNVWMHNGFVNVDNEKMSKSLGNFFTLRDVLERYDGETLRFSMLRTHYRSPFNHSDVRLDDARTGLRRLYTALATCPGLAGRSAPPTDWSVGAAARFKAAMDEDLNTPMALAVLFDLAAECNRDRRDESALLLRSLGGVLGLLQQDPDAFLQGQTAAQARVGTEPGGWSVADIEAAIAQRADAKRARDFKLADEIRQRLVDAGVLLKDSAEGTTWVRG